ncbi:25384_t:CDS:2, partial [Racocetra persica]
MNQSTAQMINAQPQNNNGQLQRPQNMGGPQNGSGQFQGALNIRIGRNAHIDLAGGTAFTRTQDIENPQLQRIQSLMLG